MSMLLNRVLKNARHLRKWARTQGCDCLRLYDHDIPEYPLTVEDYGGRLLLTLSQRAEVSPELVEELRLGLAAQEVVLKRRGERTQETLDPAQSFLVQENGMRFEVNLQGHQDSGLFLDHRLTRARVRAQAQGKRVLNLFCYSGSFSVAAALGGAVQVTSLDLSATYLDWAGRNFGHNGLSLQGHPFVRDDVLQWLPQALDAQQSYDLIVCDPPTFSNSKKMRQTFDLQRVHEPMLRGLVELLRPQGEIYFSCNERKFRLESQLGWREISDETRSPDFRASFGHRCWHWRKPAN